MQKITLFFLSLLLGGQFLSAQTGYTINGIVCNNDTLTSATTIPNLQDDMYSGKIGIGFPFCFYGTTYDSLVIGSNGCVTFNLSKANSYKPFVVPQPGDIAGVLQQKDNSILSGFQDLNPAASPKGAVSYTTLGNSPNRQFVVEYKRINHFGYINDSTFSYKVVLNELSNEIEIHIIDHPNLYFKRDKFSHR